MAEGRLSVFVSATTGDLRETRRAVRDALLTMDHVPIEQTNFPPEASTVREMLTKRIRACDAVIHIAGLRFGSEPREPEPGKPRRSYTQMEYEIARELKKKVYTFVCDADYPYDASEPEDAEKTALQQAHRARLVGGDRLFEVVATRDELEKRVGALQAQLDTLSERLRKTRRLLSISVATGVLAVLGLASFFVYVAYARTTNTQHLTAARELGLDLGQLRASDLVPRFVRNDMQQAELRVRVPEALRTIVASNQASMEADFGDGVWTQVGRDYVGGGDLQGVLSVDARNASGPLRLRIGPPWGHGSGPSFGPFSYDMSPAQFAAQEATSARSSDEPWLVHEGTMWQAHPTVLDALFPQVVAMRMGSEPDKLTQHIPTTGQGGGVDALIAPMKWKSAVAMATYTLDRQDRIYAQLEFRDGTKSAVREFVAPPDSTAAMMASQMDASTWNQPEIDNPEPRLELTEFSFPARLFLNISFCEKPEVKLFVNDSDTPVMLAPGEQTIATLPEWRRVAVELRCEGVSDPIREVLELEIPRVGEATLPLESATELPSQTAVVARCSGGRCSIQLLNPPSGFREARVSFQRAETADGASWTEFVPMGGQFVSASPSSQQVARLILIYRDGTEQGPFLFSLAPLVPTSKAELIAAAKASPRDLVGAVRLRDKSETHRFHALADTRDGLSFPAVLIYPDPKRMGYDVWAGIEKLEVFDANSRLLSTISVKLTAEDLLAAPNADRWHWFAKSHHAMIDASVTSVRMRFHFRDNTTSQMLEFPVSPVSP